MNCKPGDLAIVVISGPDTTSLVGSIVTVIKPYGMSQSGLHAWIYECAGGGLLKTDRGDEIGYIEDCCLKPIRPGDLEDETPTVRELEAA